MPDDLTPETALAKALWSTPIETDNTTMGQRADEMVAYLRRVGWVLVDLRHITGTPRPEPTTVVTSGDMAVELPIPPGEIDAFMAAIQDPEPVAPESAPIVVEVAAATDQHVDEMGKPERLARTQRRTEPTPDSAPPQVTAPADKDNSGDKVVDLMAALEESVAAAKAARKRHPQPGGTRLDDLIGDDQVAKLAEEFD